MTFAVLVESKEMVETVIASVIAGLGVTAAFSGAIWGVARFTELSSRGERTLAAGAALVAGLGLLAVAAALVFAIIVMTSK